MAIPKIAQSRVNGAKLTVQGIQLSQTQADNFTLSINSTIEADDSIHAVIDPFVGKMYLEDWPPQTPFALVNFPQTTSASMTAVNITQFTPVADLHAFTVFNQWFLTNETLRLSVEGDTKLKVNGISRKYDVKFKKTIEIVALKNFDGTAVVDSNVNLTADADGNNFFGTTVIPNRSMITFEIVRILPPSIPSCSHMFLLTDNEKGNLTFTNFMVNEFNVGTVFVDNVTIKPGNNSFPLRANISQTPVLQTIQERPYCETGIIPFELQGQNVLNHGQRLAYYADAMATTNITTDIAVLPDLQALGLTIQCSNTTTKREEVSSGGSVWLE